MTLGLPDNTKEIRFDYLYDKYVLYFNPMTTVLEYEVTTAAGVTKRLIVFLASDLDQNMELGKMLDQKDPAAQAAFLFATDTQNIAIKETRILGYDFKLNQPSVHVVFQSSYPRSVRPERP